MSIVSSAKEDHGEEHSDYYDQASHHLVDGGGRHCERNEHESTATHIATRWNRQPQRIDISLHLDFLRGSRAWRQQHILALLSGRSLIQLNFDGEEQVNGQLTNEHARCLDVRVREQEAPLAIEATLWRLTQIEVLSDNRVGRPCHQHTQHDTVQDYIGHLWFLNFWHFI